MSTKVGPDRAEAVESLLGWLGSLRVGEPLIRGGLAVAPIYRDEKQAGPRYTTLAKAMASGDVTVVEAPQASVPTLSLINKGSLDVLILDGEEVQGGLQNRVVNTTLLVAAFSTFELPVSCVEHGRWSRASTTFQAGEAAYPTLRQQKIEQVSTAFELQGAPVADQVAVWNEIAQRQRTNGTSSATGAMRDVYAQKHVELAETERSFRFPADKPIGVIALVRGRAFCADLFDQPSTLRAYWPRLVRSYSLEASGSPAREPSRGSAERLLRRPIKARSTPFASPGLGIDVRINGNGVVGAALVHNGAVVHTALFRKRRSRVNEPKIQRPTYRSDCLGL